MPRPSSSAGPSTTTALSIGLASTDDAPFSLRPEPAGPPRAHLCGNAASHQLAPNNALAPPRLSTRSRSYSDAMTGRISLPSPHTSVCTPASLEPSSSPGEIRDLQEVLRRVKRKKEPDAHKSLRSRMQPLTLHARMPSFGALRNLRWYNAGEPDPLPSDGDETSISLTDSTANALDHVCTKSARRPQLGSTQSYSSIRSQIVVQGVEVIQSRNAFDQGSGSTASISSFPALDRNSPQSPPQSLPPSLRNSFVEDHRQTPPEEADEVEHLLSSPPLASQVAFLNSAQEPSFQQSRLEQNHSIGRPATPIPIHDQHLLVAIDTPRSDTTHVTRGASRIFKGGHRSSNSDVGPAQQKISFSPAASQSLHTRPSFGRLSPSRSENDSQKRNRPTWLLSNTSIGSIKSSQEGYFSSFPPHRSTGLPVSHPYRTSLEENERMVPMISIPSPSETKCSSPVDGSTAHEGFMFPPSGGGPSPISSSSRTRSMNPPNPYSPNPYSPSIRSLGGGGNSWLSCSTLLSDGPESKMETTKAASAPGIGTGKWPTSLAMEREAVVPLQGSDKVVTQPVDEDEEVSFLPSLNIDKPTSTPLPLPQRREGRRVLPRLKVPPRLEPLARLGCDTDRSTVESRTGNSQEAQSFECEASEWRALAGFFGSGMP
ncbi:hypothetical protein CF326_g2610 [Tilletia indica]|uniref:Uncharacterized protein n=1 Tax=Tilletia indica TaxID=43049 RepID=A0A177TN34_9BASI|nr:hypothetical protein CF326_g2610 [Tilletia indica]KAE8258786.1 hypothetical protein A4X13_0g1462 [Tilletia indica]